MMTSDYPLSRKPRMLFLFSDTGGGHRSAAEAIIEALDLEFGDRIQTEMVDFFKAFAPLPFNQLPKWYPYLVKVPEMWGLGFLLSDGSRRVRFINEAAWPYVRSASRRFAQQVSHDLIVSVHPVVNNPLMRAMGKVHRPYVTVVTDLVSTHAMWYNPRVDLCIVPTESARQLAVKYGMPNERLRVIGLPVAERFCHPVLDRPGLRARLGWPQDLPVILLMGGGEGMGPLEQIANAIAEANAPAALVVICGRNQTLKERLEARAWPIPTRVYGFVREMPDFMGAADILVTKAGPGTICEAFNAGLPLILYSRLPGQEDGNVRYVMEEKAGIWAPSSDQVVAALCDWLEHPDKRRQAGEAARALARPQAARQIARVLAGKVGVM